MSRPVEKAPEELTGDRLRRIGEGIGKVVYASAHWVVHRERTAREIISLILLWRWLRSFSLGRRLRRGSPRLIRALRLSTEAVIAVIPKRLWYTKQVEQ